MAATSTSSSCAQSNPSSCAQSQDLPKVDPKQLEAIEAQLGRLPRGVVSVAASCSCGAPLVAKTAPRLPDGTPFPTTYYLTHPGITAAVSRLEADGLMKQFNARLAEDAG